MVETIPPSAIVAEAERALGAGDTDTARALSEHVLGSFARHGRASLVRALLAERAGDSDAALDDLRFVTSVDPSNAQARAAQARVFARRADQARALEMARMAVELIPADPSVLESALEILAIDADSLPPTPAVIARIHLASGWSALAERHARVAVAEQPQRVDIRLTLAEALWREGRLSACEDQCKVIFDQANDCVRAAVMRAHILSEHGRTAEGQDLLSRVGEIDPEFVEARHMLGLLEIHRLVLPPPPELAWPEAMRGVEEEVESADHASQSVSVAPPGEPAPDPADDPPAPDPGDDSARQPEPPAGADSGAPAGEFSALSGIESAPRSNPSESEAPRPAAGEAASDDAPPSFPRPDTQSPNASDLAGRDAPSNGDGETPQDSSLAAEEEDSSARTDEGAAGGGASVGAPLSKLGWARELIAQRRWREAEPLVAELVREASESPDEVESLLVDSAAIAEAPPGFWKLLGDFYMQSSRPQAAAEAYLRAERPR